MQDQTVDSLEMSTTAKRPTFLTVLCIITFVVSGYNLIVALFGIFQSESFDPAEWQAISDQMAEAMAGAGSGSQEMATTIMTSLESMMQVGAENSVLIGLVAIIASALSILGAYLMFKLKKIGYYTYILAKVIGVLVPLFIFGFNILTLMIYGFVALIGILFIALYGVNRKHLS